MAAALRDDVSLRSVKWARLELGIVLTLAAASTVASEVPPMDAVANQRQRRARVGMIDRR